MSISVVKNDVEYIIDMLRYYGYEITHVMEGCSISGFNEDTTYRIDFSFDN